MQLLGLEQTNALKHTTSFELSKEQIISLSDHN